MLLRITDLILFIFFRSFSSQCWRCSVKISVVVKDLRLKDKDKDKDLSFEDKDEDKDLHRH